MKALDALNKLSDLCARQKGLFTSAQAQEAGVSRTTLTRLAAHQQIVFVARGVYRAATAPVLREEPVYAAWLSLDPKTPAWKRNLDNTDYVVSRETAAWLYGFDEFDPKPYAFASSERKQTRNKDIHLFKHTIKPEDIRVVDGLPALSRQRTATEILKYCPNTQAIIDFLITLTPEERPLGMLRLLGNRETKFSSLDAHQIRSVCNLWRKEDRARMNLAEAEITQVDPIASALSSEEKDALGQL